MSSLADLEGAYTVGDLVNRQTGEVLLEANKPLTAEIWAALAEAGITSVDVFFPERDDVGVVLSRTLDKDAIRSPREALIEIYRKLRPGDPPTLETATRSIQRHVLRPAQVRFQQRGPLEIQHQVRPGDAANTRTLDSADFVAAIRYLLKLRKNIGTVDDIDHLGNRRVRAVGELLENQFRIGLVRMERAIKEKMSVYQEMSTAMPHDLVNAKPVMAAIREFFGSSQLSQFMDQTNPLSEITHKRRLSALGPGGLSRERAGFEVRDVHPTHYGRICPIETPEGPNIGLISSLSCYARINEFGFIESPYRKVKGGRVIDYVQIVNAGESEFKAGEIVERDKVEAVNEELKRRKVTRRAYCFYLSAWEEDRYVVAQANVPLDERGKHHHRTGQLPSGRKLRAEVARGSRLHRRLAEAARLGRRQPDSVPGKRRRQPRLDGFEHATPGRAADSRRSSAGRHRHGTRHRARFGRGGHLPPRRHRRSGGLRAHHRARRIRPLRRAQPRSRRRHLPAHQVQALEPEHLHQPEAAGPRRRPRAQGQVLADGPCTDRGELALGRNVLVAFVPWRGYNFEDAILVSEKLVKDDYYTSIHIEEFEIEARDTKLGPEEITRDIPNISEMFLRNLDESGVIRIGATVRPGDILVGKVTPKGETTLTPEEKLLRAIFGEKAGDVRDASLYCPPGIEGTVVDVKIFCRKGAEKDERHKAIEAAQVFKLEKNLVGRNPHPHRRAPEAPVRAARRQGLLADLHDEKTNKRLITKGTELTRDIIEKIATRNLKRLRLADKDPLLIEKIDEIEEMTSRQIDVLRKITEERKEKLSKGDELPPGVIKLVKCYIAMKRKLSVGDKMAGRHGNKGVIARIVPEEDMPYLPDGTPVEIVLNPLGVPSRMNVGQILETHLGWASKELGRSIARLLDQHKKADAVAPLVPRSVLRHRHLEDADGPRRRHAARIRRQLPRRHSDGHAGI